jgi:hypothetical protein
MKKIITVFTAVIFNLLPTASALPQIDPAKVNSLDISKLSTENKAELMTKVVNMHSSENNSEKVRNETAKWAELGSNIGRASVAAAKEFGIAANDFVNTPLGKITTAVVIYKIMGRDIIGIILGIIIITFCSAIGSYMLIKNKYSAAEYEIRPILFGLMNKKIVKSFTIEQDTVGWQLFFGTVFIILGFILGLNIIF